MFEIFLGFWISSIIACLMIFAMVVYGAWVYIHNYNFRKRVTANGKKEMRKYIIFYLIISFTPIINTIVLSISLIFFDLLYHKLYDKIDKAYGIKKNVIKS